MKKLMIGALIGAQLMATQPAMAAEPGRPVRAKDGHVRRASGPDGTGRPCRCRCLRAGLAIAPAMHSRQANGELRLRIGEGFELGVRGCEPVRLSIAGRDFQRLAAQGNEREQGRPGVPTGLWIAGGIVLVTIAGVAAIALVLEDAVTRRARRPSAHSPARPRPAPARPALRIIGKAETASSATWV